MPTPLTSEQIEVLRQRQQLLQQSQPPPTPRLGQLGPGAADRALNAPRQTVQTPSAGAPQRGQPPLLPRARGAAGEALSFGGEVAGSLAGRIAAARVLATALIPPWLRALLTVGGGAVGAMGGRAAGEVAEEALAPGEFRLTADDLKGSTIEAAFNELAGEAFSLGLRGTSMGARALRRKALGKPAQQQERAFRAGRQLTRQVPEAHRTEEVRLLEKMPLTFAERMSGGTFRSLQELTMSSAVGGRLKGLVIKRDLGTIQTMRGILSAIAPDLDVRRAGRLTVDLIESGNKSQQLLANAFYAPVDEVGEEIFVRTTGGPREFALDEVLRAREAGIKLNPEVSGENIARGILEADASHNPLLRNKIKTQLLQRAEDEAIELDADEIEDAVTKIIRDNYTTLRGAVEQLKRISTTGEVARRTAKTSPGIRAAARSKPLIQHNIEEALMNAGREDLIPFINAGRAVASARKDTYEQELLNKIIRFGVHKTGKQPDAVLDMLWGATDDQVEIIMNVIKSDPAKLSRELLADIRKDFPGPPDSAIRRVEQELEESAKRAVGRNRAIRAVRRLFAARILSESFVKGLTDEPRTRLSVAALDEVMEDHGREKLVRIMGKEATDNFNRLRDLLREQQRKIPGSAFSLIMAIKQAQAIVETTSALGSIILTGTGNPFPGLGLGALVFGLPISMAEVLQSKKATNKLIAWARHANRAGSARDRGFSRHTVRFLNFLDRFAQEMTAENQDLAGTSIHFPLPEQHTTATQATPGPLVPRTERPNPLPGEMMSPREQEELRRGIRLY